MATSQFTYNSPAGPINPSILGLNPSISGALTGAPSYPQAAQGAQNIINQANSGGQVLGAATSSGNNNTSSSSGGGSGSYQDQWAAAGHPGTAPVGYHGEASGPQGVSQEEIDAAYNPVFGDIQGLRDNALNNQQTYMNAATSPFDALQPDIDQAQTQGLNLNQQQANQNNTTTQNALASARQLFNELQQGVQQRFGGVSSTGDFAKAFYGRQLQQNEGGIYNTAGQNQQALQTQAANIVSQHDNNIKQLGAQKAAALSNAQLQFQNMLQQIDQLKTQTDQQKASAKLDALTQLKATANAINNQFTQFQQQLTLQNQSALDQLRNRVATAQAYSGHPVDLSSIAPLYASQMGGGQTSQNPLFGVTGNMGNRDQFGATGQIAPQQKLNQSGVPVQ